MWKQRNVKFWLLASAIFHHFFIIINIAVMILIITIVVFINFHTPIDSLPCVPADKQCSRQNETCSIQMYLADSQVKLWKSICFPSKTHFLSLQYYIDKKPMGINGLHRTILGMRGN